MDSEEKKTILMNYPDPVPVQKLLIDAARWSGKKFILDPGLNRDIQIFSQEKLSATEAFNLLLASLETIGLRSISFEGGIIKIVSSPGFATRV